MELNPKSTESIIEVNLFWKLNYNKLPHLLLNSNCGNWKTVYIYKKNTGGGNRRSKTPYKYNLPLNMTFELVHKTNSVSNNGQWWYSLSILIWGSIIERFLSKAPVAPENYWNEVLQLNKFSVQFGRGVLRWKPIWSLGLKQTGLVSALAPAPSSNALAARGARPRTPWGVPGIVPDSVRAN